MGRSDGVTVSSDVLDNDHGDGVNVSRDVLDNDHGLPDHGLNEVSAASAEKCNHFIIPPLWPE